MIDTDNIPTRASEVLISKICHDLVSPVGAINNGIEFLADMGGAENGLEDGLGLIEHSARQASVRLQLFRMCYGAGGSDAKITGKMIYETFQNFIKGTKASMEWDLLNDMPDEELPSGYLKTVLNLLVFTHEAMPKGGKITITYDGTSMIVSAQSDRVKAKDGAAEALKGELNIDDLSPKSVHGFITKSYADLYGFTIDSHLDEQSMTFKVTA